MESVHEILCKTRFMEFGSILKTSMGFYNLKHHRKENLSQKYLLLDCYSL